MRFPRHAKIFRGQLEMAPLANVLFLLLIFILLGSLLYTPGIPYRLEAGTSDSLPPSQMLLIAKNGDIIFAGKTNKIGETDQLRTDFQNLPKQTSLIVQEEAAAPKEIKLFVRNLAQRYALHLSTPDRGISLPSGEGLSGTPNPTIVVSVNFGGQFFYENRLLTEAELSVKLQNAVRQSREPLTLLVLADKSVPNEVTMSLAEMARTNGIKEMMIAGRSSKH